MTTVPITAVRQALDDTEAALARLRPALGAAYGIAGENLTRSAGQLDVAERAQAAAERRAEDAERQLRALRGVTDTARAEQAETKLAEAERRISILAAVDEGRAHGARRIMNERDQAQQRATAAEQRLDKHRRTLAAILARSAETPLDELTEYAAKTLTRSGERLLDAGERLDAAEKARAEAERATQTLLRIKHARTAADAWTALGTHYHLSPTEAGRRARDWRSTAERDATKRAETASVLGARYMGDAERHHSAWQSARGRARAHFAEQQRIRGWLTHWADRARVAESDAERFHAAWQNARLRAKQAKAREEKANERAERHHNTRRRWLELADEATEREAGRARRAGQRLAAVRQYLAAAHAADITPGVRDDLALILNGQPTTYAPMEGQ
ncbi:hypothetical protein [Streptomyces sp. NPDC026589]|uniref:hypothetical protein n=1 Tax=Streptomyces sp. NPDC026589 TaxID=3155609 RepID=UPI0033E7B362